MDSRGEVTDWRGVLVEKGDERVGFVPVGGCPAPARGRITEAGITI